MLNTYIPGTAFEESSDPSLPKSFSIDSGICLIRFRSQNTPTMTSIILEKWILALLNTIKLPVSSLINWKKKGIIKKKNLAWKCNIGHSNRIFKAWNELEIFSNIKNIFYWTPIACQSEKFKWVRRNYLVHLHVSLFLYQIYYLTVYYYKFMYSQPLKLKTIKIVHDTQTTRSLLMCIWGEIYIYRNFLLYNFFTWHTQQILIIHF